MVDLYERAERLMGMTDAVWLRHMSNWSVWTRMLMSIPLLTITIWSRVWLGWAALVPMAVAFAFIWLNPRLFPAPQTFESWAARGVLGERVWLKKRKDVAAHHIAVCHTLTTFSALGACLWLWGVVTLDVWAALIGGILTMVFKVWFVDRTAWIWDDFKRNGGSVDDLKGQ